MNAVLHAAKPRTWNGEGRPRAVAAWVAIVALLCVAVLIGWAIGRPGMTGRYQGADGRSVLEFRGSRVYVTSSLGTTFVTEYEVDGDRVIIKGAGGAQVYTREGNTLDGGVGIRFVKQ